LLAAQLGTLQSGLDRGSLGLKHVTLWFDMAQFAFDAPEGAVAILEDKQFFYRIGHRLKPSILSAYR
jgi:hypothetical protein